VPNPAWRRDVVLRQGRADWDTLLALAPISRGLSKRRIRPLIEGLENFLGVYDHILVALGTEEDVSVGDKDV
jgi:hypothetical protein